MLCGKGQSLPSCLNWLPFVFIRGLINWACADPVTFFPSLSHSESRYTRNCRCPPILLTLSHHQQPLPSTFVPLHFQLFLVSALFISTRLKHATSCWFCYCCCTSCFGVYLISNLVKIPSHQLACPGKCREGDRGPQTSNLLNGSWREEAAGRERGDISEQRVIYQSKVGNEAVKQNVTWMLMTWMLGSGPLLAICTRSLLLSTLGCPWATLRKVRHPAAMAISGWSVLNQELKPTDWGAHYAACHHAAKMEGSSFSYLDGAPLLKHTPDTCRIYSICCVCFHDSLPPFPLLPQEMPVSSYYKSSVWDPVTSDRSHSHILCEAEQATETRSLSIQTNELPFLFCAGLDKFPSTASKLQL